MCPSPADLGVKSNCGDCRLSPTALLVSMTGRAAAQEPQLEDKEQRRTTTGTRKKTHRLFNFYLYPGHFNKKLSAVSPTFTCSTRATRSHPDDCALA